jgi:hypothetical protein
MDTQRTFNRLFLRLQLQARLRETAAAVGEAEMLELLQQALAIEFRYHDQKAHKKGDQVNT